MELYGTIKIAVDFNSFGDLKATHDLVSLFYLFSPLSPVPAYPKHVRDSVLNLVMIAPIHIFRWLGHPGLGAMKYNTCVVGIDTLPVFKVVSKELP